MIIYTEKREAIYLFLYFISLLHVIVSTGADKRKMGECKAGLQIFVLRLSIMYL
jgi:hypothetical protein